MTTTRESVGSQSAQRAYQRRNRREERIDQLRLTGVGSPVGAAMSRVPFVFLVIAILGAGTAGVLWLNTMTDEAGLETTRSREASAELRLELESLQREVSMLDSTPKIAQEARELGLVQAGSPAIIMIGADGKPTVIGTPTPVPAPAPAPAGANR